jgi:hypothetical protein
MNAGIQEMAILDEEVGTASEDVSLVVEDACHAFEAGVIAS